MSLGDLEKLEIRGRVHLELAEASERTKHTVPRTLAGSGNRLLFHLSEAQQRSDIAGEESLARRGLAAAAAIEQATCEAVQERVYVTRAPHPPASSPPPPDFLSQCRMLCREEREARVVLSNELLASLRAVFRWCDASARMLQVVLAERHEICTDMERELRALSRAAVREAPLFLVAQPTAFFHQHEAEVRHDAEAALQRAWVVIAEDVRRQLLEAIEADERRRRTDIVFTFCLLPEWTAVTGEERLGRNALEAEELEIRREGSVANSFAALLFAQHQFDLFALERYSRRVFETMSLRTMHVLAVESAGRRSVDDAFLEVLCRGKVIPFAMSLQFRRKQVAERIAALEGSCTPNRRAASTQSSDAPRSDADGKAREAWKLHFELTALIETIHRAMSSSIICHHQHQSLDLAPSPPSAKGSAPPQRLVSVSARCKKFDALRLRRTHDVQSVAIFASPTKASI